MLGREVVAEIVTSVVSGADPEMGQTVVYEVTVVETIGLVVYGQSVTVAAQEEIVTVAVAYTVEVVMPGWPVVAGPELEVALPEGDGVAEAVLVLAV